MNELQYFIALLQGICLLAVICTVIVTVQNNTQINRLRKRMRDVSEDFNFYVESFDNERQGNAEHIADMFRQSNDQLRRIENLEKWSTIIDHRYAVVDQFLNKMAEDVDDLP